MGLGGKTGSASFRVGSLNADMTYVLIILTLAVAALGAFTDVRFGRVRNRHLLAGLAVWIILIVIASLVNGQLTLSPLPWLINLGFSVVAAVIFYMLDIWAPGDCKLFLFIAITLPLEVYTVRDGNVFPSLNLVVLSFAFGYIALLIGALVRRGTQESPKQGDGKQAERQKLPLDWRRVLSIIANMGLFSATISLITAFFSDFFYANQMLCSLTLIGIICFLQGRFERTRKVLGAIGVISFVVQMVFQRAWLGMLFGALEGLIIALIIEIINNRVRKNTYREITGEEVRPGMILSFATIWNMQKCIDPELPHTTTENRRSRLTPRQAEAVQTWCKNAKQNVIIVEMMPFAPCLAIAVAVQTLVFIISRIR